MLFECLSSEWISELIDERADCFSSISESSKARIEDEVIFRELSSLSPMACKDSESCEEKDWRDKSVLWRPLARIDDAEGL